MEVGDSVWGEVGTGALPQQHQQQHQQQQQQQFVRGGVSNSNAISEERIRDFLQEKAEGLQQLQTPLMAETEAPRQASDMPHGASGLAGSSAEAEPSCGPFEEREEANGAQVEKQAARVGDGTRRVASPSNQKQTGVGTGVGQTIPGQGQGQGQGQAPVSSRPAGLTPSPRRHRESSPARRKRILKESFALPRDLSPSARLQPQAPAAAAAAAAPAVAPAAAAPAVAFSSPSTATQSPSVSLPSPSLPPLPPLRLPLILLLHCPQIPPPPFPDHALHQPISYLQPWASHVTILPEL
ncbi:hypothetical protein CLOP_g10477 [Closterium sp. NIES-67]|nr:hypothetical protein CLOP_g10477 [Closterium sp. NIES-67]